MIDQNLKQRGGGKINYIKAMCIFDLNTFRRKGRSRTVSTNSQARRNRLNSADSSYATSGDECLLSPNDNQVLSNKDSCENSPSKEAGLLLALAHCENSNRSDMKVRILGCLVSATKIYIYV